jgi:acyl-CoA synthetase (AMP-forming)/AMP-acid ligase II
VNLNLLLTMAADAMGDRPAVGPAARPLTYAELRGRAERAAAWIDARRPEHVGLVDVNSEAVPVLLFGCALAGVPLAPINYRLADDRLRAALGMLGSAVVVVDATAAARVDVPAVAAVPRTQFLAELELAEPWTEPEPAGDDVAVRLFTSGTSGEPKSAVLRHRHLVSYVISTVEFMGAEEGDAALVSVPPYHIAGISAVASSVYAGRRIVYLPSFDAAAWVELARREAVTHAMVVPTMMARILDVLEQRGERLPALRHLSYGGGRMPLPVVERALTLLPHVGFVNAYGLTETSSTVTLLGPDDHRAAFTATDEAVRRRLGSVGQPVPGIELEVRDEDGHVLPPGTSGSIWLRGEQVSGEYSGLDEPAGGWFDTNDRGFVDGGGYVFLEGRTDDVIVRGGENLSPGEIEDVLAAHPAVAEAAVVGVPSEAWGQVPVAAVVASAAVAPTEEELRAWVRERLRSARTPERIVFVDELPYTDTGKLLRRSVAELLLTLSRSPAPSSR